MAVIQRPYDLLKHAKRLVRWQAAHFAEVVKKLPTLDVFQDEIKMSRGLPDVVELHDVRVIDQFHDDNFALDGEKNSLSKRAIAGQGFGGPGQGQLGYDLYRGFLVRLHMSS